MLFGIFGGVPSVNFESVVCQKVLLTKAGYNTLKKSKGLKSSLSVK
jgi:hypothetical protein